MCTVSAQNAARRLEVNSISRAGELKNCLDSIYDTYNRPGYITPDPYEVVLEYTEPADYEIAGFIASALAFGRASAITSAAGTVLEALRGRPRAALESISHDDLKRRLGSFVYRFVDDASMIHFLSALKGLLAEYGSIRDAFAGCIRSGDNSIQDALARFVSLVRGHAGGSCGFLLPDPGKNSACKRLHLFLRWMVRHDAVDKGQWMSVVNPSVLMIPLDVHMHKISRRLGFTVRKSVDRKTVLEVTEAFSKINPEDPVKYDFCLSRFGIHPDLSIDLLPAA